MVNEVLEYLRCRNWGVKDSAVRNGKRSDAKGSNTRRSDTTRGDAASGDGEEVEANPVFLDATLGTAGHTLAILQANPACRVIAFDRDADSMEYARRRLEAAQVAHRVALVQGDFRNAPELLQPFFENWKVEAGVLPASETAISGDSLRSNPLWSEPIKHINGALIDAGMSLYQVTWAERGLSFRADAPLDMRYDRTQEISAFDLVNRLSASELEDLLFKFTDERWARRIAATIVEHRRRHVIRTTAELVSLIEAAIPAAVRRQSRVHPATKTFAALRLAVNDEFWALDQGAWAISSVLAPAARLVVLTYSSNEDRTVKRTFRRLAGRPLDGNFAGTIKRPHHKRKPDVLSLQHRASGTARSPLAFSLSLPTDEEPTNQAGASSTGSPFRIGWGETWGMKIITPKPVTPSPEEVAANPLARSCKLRAIEKFTID